MTNKFEKLHMQSSAYLVALVEELREALIEISEKKHQVNCYGVSRYKVVNMSSCNCHVGIAKEALGE